ncbi:MAG: HupE/UreJ family protein [Sediminibacterium sp.]
MTLLEDIQHGIFHIIDKGAIDHILFLWVLAIGLTFNDRRLLLWSITGFTLGHALAAVAIVFSFPMLPLKWVEFAIPLTIVARGIQRLISPTETTTVPWKTILVIAIFGFIHGSAISTELKMTLMKDESLVGKLVGFNMGVELGQLLCIGGILLISVTLNRLLRIHANMVTRILLVPAIILAIGLFYYVFPLN